jgi:hypothetical protein
LIFVAQIASRDTVSDPKIVTLPQQSVPICHGKSETPKKAAVAVVFGLPEECRRDVDLRVKAGSFAFRGT